MRDLGIAIVLLGLAGLCGAQSQPGVIDAQSVEQLDALLPQFLENFELGNRGEAASEGRRLMNLAVKGYAAGHPRIAAMTINAAEAAYENFETDRARKLYLLAIERKAESYGEASIEVVDATLKAIKASVSRGDAMMLANRAAKTAEQIHGKDDEARYDARLRAGMELLTKKHVDDARRYIVKAHKDIGKYIGTDSLMFARANYWRGRLEFTRGYANDAVPHLLEATRLYANAQRESENMNLSAHAILVQSYEQLGESDKATEHCLFIGRVSPIVPADQMQPIFRATPFYPHNALLAGKEGSVDFRFTVLADGRVDDIRIEGGENLRLFEESATRAVENFRYAPRIVDGLPEPTRDVMTRVSFRIASR